MSVLGTKSVWSILGKARLQELIGEDVLERLAILLPALQPDTDQSLVYTSDGLTKIFDSFSGANALEKPKFRQELFNALPQDILQKLVQKIAPQKQSSPWDEKVKVISSAWKERESAAIIATDLGISPDFLPQDYQLPPVELLLKAADLPYKPLKDYQSSIFFEASERLLTARSRFMLQMPTGSGKTRTAVELISDYLNGQKSNNIVFWLVHSEELCEQAYECFIQIWPHLARKDLRLVRCWGSDAAIQLNFPEAGFVVGSFPKLASFLKREPDAFEALSQRVGLLVVDEAHKVLAPTYREVVAALMSDNTSVVGLTATPGRSIVNQEQNEALAKFFFNQILTIQSGNVPVIEFLKNRRVLAKTEYVPLISGRSYNLTEAERKYFETYFDFSPGMLARLGKDDLRNVEIVKRLEHEVKEGNQIIFFGCSVEHSKFVCALLNFLRISAVHIDGTTNRTRRQTLLKEFKESKIKVLCNYGLLSTGFDAPKINVVFIARPTGSIVLYSQMIGRGLRGTAIGGTDWCRVIDVKDNIEGYSNEVEVYDYFTDYYSVNKDV
jgi:superfamily II DNA or RNA helicase